MDAKKLMDEVSSRTSGLNEVYKKGEDFASRAAHKARELYSRVEEQLPEESMKYAAYGLAGVTIGTVFYQLGKSRMRRSMLSEASRRVSQTAQHTRNSAEQRLSLAKDSTKSAAQSVEQFDFNPIYKLAKLWLIYKISL